MKKLLSCTLALCMLLVLAACGSKPVTPPPSPSVTEEQTTPEEQATPEEQEPVVTVVEDVTPGEATMEAYEAYMSKRAAMEKEFSEFDVASLNIPEGTLFDDLKVENIPDPELQGKWLSKYDEATFIFTEDTMLIELGTIYANLITEEPAPQKYIVNNGVIYTKGSDYVEDDDGSKETEILSITLYTIEDGTLYMYTPYSEGGHLAMVYKGETYADIADKVLSTMKPISAYAGQYYTNYNHDVPVFLAEDGTLTCGEHQATLFLTDKAEWAITDGTSVYHGKPSFDEENGEVFFPIAVEEENEFFSNLGFEFYDYSEYGAGMMYTLTLLPMSSAEG